MSNRTSIEVDLDVMKLIWGARTSMDESNNMVLRRLLKLSAIKKVHIPEKKEANEGRPWANKGVTLPHGTELRMDYNNQRYEGQIEDGRWIVEGGKYSTPSGAAINVAVTRHGHRTHLNGWRYWQIRKPGETKWHLLESLKNSPEFNLPDSIVDL